MHHVDVPNHQISVTCCEFLFLFASPTGYPLASLMHNRPFGVTAGASAFSLDMALHLRSVLEADPFSAAW